MTNEEYVAKNGSVCPFCGTDNIEAGAFDYDGAYYQNVVCHECNKEWIDEYSLTGFTDLEELK